MKNDEFCISNEELVLKMMDFAFKIDLAALVSVVVDTSAVPASGLVEMRVVNRAAGVVLKP